MYKGFESSTSKSLSTRNSVAITEMKATTIKNGVSKPDRTHQKNIKEKNNITALAKIFFLKK